MSKIRRAELLQFYKKKEGEEREESAKDISKREDPIDVDSENYHLQLSVDTVITTHNLPRLVTYHNQMVEEIKSYDKNLKILIYNNYTKLLDINAVLDRNKVSLHSNPNDKDKSSGSFDTKIAAISSHLEQFKPKLNAMSAVLSPQRSKIQQLNEIYTNLEQLKMILRLPTSLAELFNKRRYAEAINVNKRIKSMLKNCLKNGDEHQKQDELNLSASHRIIVDVSNKCQAIVTKIDAKVMDKYLTGSNGLPSLYQGFGLLLGLEIKPAADLAKLFTYRAGTAFDELFETLKFDFFDNGKLTDAERIKKFSNLCTEFLGELGNFASCYKAFFLERFVASSVSGTLVSDMDKLKEQVYAESLSPIERERCQKDIIEFLTRNLENFYLNVKKQVDLEVNIE
jgi:hypothetical protein